MILLQNDASIVCLLGFAKAMQYTSKYQKICYGAKGFMGYLERGNACELNFLNFLKIKNKLNFFKCS